MTVTVDQFRARFPEFCDKNEYTPERVQLFLDDATIFIGTDENHWGGSVKYNRAQSYLSAHLLVKATKSEMGDTNSSGNITSKSAGGVSVTRSSPDVSNMSTDDADLMSTTYGQEYIKIRDLCFSGILVATYG